MRPSFLIVGIMLALALSACGTLSRPDGPIRITDGYLTPAEDPRIRADDTTGPGAFAEQMGARFVSNRPVSILALSGGGANGAYGAGLLVGWSEHGDRPQFDVVTGVSTGALAAPFAFLGPDWDAQLERAYTGGGADNLLSARTFAAFFNPSLFSNRVLKDLVDDNVTRELLQAIAREHARGRRLLVATTDLDSQQTVIWDMGLLASQNDPNAYALFKQVLVASASIPGVFPPVLIAGLRPDRTVEVEMHVDGGVNSPFLAIPEPLLLWTRPAGGTTPTSLYVVVNGQVGRNNGVTPGRLTDILMRSYDSMSKASLRTHLAATTAFARRNGIAMSMAAIPDNVEASSLSFDQEAMTALFELGRGRGRTGQAWIRLDQVHDGEIVPPNLAPESQIPETLRLSTPEQSPLN